LRWNKQFYGGFGRFAGDSGRLRGGVGRLAKRFSRFDVYFSRLGEIFSRFADFWLDGLLENKKTSLETACLDNHIIIRTKF
jgi:hypothetical protein